MELLLILDALSSVQPCSRDVVRMQAVCITDPVLATQVLQSKVVDKLRFPYSFLDPVSPHPAVTPHAALFQQCRGTAQLCV